MIARRDDLRGDPDDFLVVECKDWHQVPVQRDAVEAVALRAALTRAMPVLAVACRVTESAWRLAQLLDVRIMTEQDLNKGQLPPLTKRRPPSGTLHVRREPFIQDLRDRLPLLVHRRSGLDIEAPVFHAADNGPCYVPDRKGNDEYVKTASSGSGDSSPSVRSRFSRRDCQCNRSDTELRFQKQLAEDAL